MPVHRHKDSTAICTDITLYTCDVITNKGGGFLLLDNIDTSHYCKPSIKFIGPLYIENNSISTRGEISMMHTYHMVIYFDSPVRISSNTVYHNDIILFRSCHVFTKRPIMISHNIVLGKNIVSLKLCSAVFKGLIYNIREISKSTMFFEKSDIIFDKEITFVSNLCDGVMTIKSEYKEYPYIKVMQHANVTFFDNKYYGNLLTFESDDNSNYPYPFCLFQYM